MRRSRSPTGRSTATSRRCRWERGRHRKDANDRTERHPAAPYSDAPHPHEPVRCPLLGGLVDGATIMRLFGDLATELAIRQDGDESLFRAYEQVEFLAPMRAGTT